MLAEMQQKKLAWPQLTTQDFSDLLVYFRNLPAKADKLTAIKGVTVGNGSYTNISQGAMATSN